MRRADDFWANVDVRGPDECWPWKGGRRVREYGGLLYEGKIRLAHHVAFKLANGFYAPYLRHSCDNPPCCNPRHLLQGSHQDNVKDKVARGRQAHGSAIRPTPFDDDDIRAIRASPRGHRCIAEIYGVVPSVICRIRTRKTWKHVA